MCQHHSDDLGVHVGNPREVPALFVNRKWRRSPKATINLIHDGLYDGSNRLVLMGLWTSYELDHPLSIYLGLQPNRLPSGLAAILGRDQGSGVVWFGIESDIDAVDRVATLFPPSFAQPLTARRHAAAESCYDAFVKPEGPTGGTMIASLLGLTKLSRLRDQTIFFCEREAKHSERRNFCCKSDT
jgi:hypothetical protein